MFSVLFTAFRVDKLHAAYTTADPLTQIAGGAICLNTSGNQIYTVELDGFFSATTITGLSISTTGSTYTTSDITTFRLYTSATNNFSTATLRSTITAGGPGTQSFTGFSVNLGGLGTLYAWVTCDVAAGATPGRTVKVASMNGTPAPTLNNAGAGNTFYIGPPAGVTATLSGNPLCVASTLNLTGAATGATSYLWVGPTGGAAMTSTTTVSTRVTSVTALNAGIYTLTATNTCGSTQAVTAALAVNQLPTFTGVAQTPNPGCVGSSMSLSATTSASGVGPIVYAWTHTGGTAISNASSLTSASVNPLVAANAGTYTITATVAGCAGNATRTSTAAMTVNQLPVFTGVTQSPSTACVGATMTLAASTSTAGTGPITYAWAGPGGTAITNPTSLTTASVNPLAAGNAGIYTITGTIAGCGSTTGTSSTPMAVNQLPTFTGVTQSPNPGCVGSIMTLAASTSAAGAGTIVYAWTGPGGTAITNPSSLTTASVNVLSAGNAGNYTITATAAGCAGSATRVSTTAMSVNQLPAFTGVTESPNPGCVGASMTLAAAVSSAGSGPITYTWTGPGGTAITNPASLTTASVNALAAGNAGIYTISATVPGCSGAAIGTSALAMVVSQLPVFTGVTQSPNPACEGASTILAATTSTAGLGPISYTWSGPGGTAITNPSSLTTASINPLVAANTGSYTISATVAGCAGTNTGVSTIPLAVNTQPLSVLPSVSPSPACIGDLVNFAGNVTGGTSLTYSWAGPVTGDISSASSADATINTVAVADAGSYTLTVTAAGCAPVSGTTSPLVVNTLPSSIGAGIGPNPACVGGSVVLGGGASIDGVGVIYSWTGPVTSDISSPSSLTANISSVSLLDAGVYTLTATLSNGCPGSMSATTPSLAVNEVPSILLASLTSSPACVGDVMGLIGEDSGDGTGVVFAWSGPVTAHITDASSETTNIASLSLSDAGAYTLTATAPGCPTNITAVTTELSVKQLPSSMTASITSANPECFNNTIVLNGSISGGSGYDVLWAGPGGGDIEAPTAASTSITAASLADAGVYTLTATAAGCVGNVVATTATLTVNILPTTVTASVSPNPACYGDIITLSGGDSGDGVGVTFSWTGPVPGDISSASSESASISAVSFLDAGVYTLTATAAGCAGSTIGESSSLEVNALPSSVTADVTPTPACTNDEITLTGTDSGDGLGVLFEWTGPVTGDILDPFSESTSILFAGTFDAGIYTLTATAPGCSGNVVATTAALVVNQLPSTVTASVSPAPACVGDDVTLMGGGSGDGVGVAFSWDGPATGDISDPSSQTTDIIGVDLSDAGVYTLTVTAPGCAGGVVATTAALAVNALPTSVTADVSPNPACAGDNIALNGGDAADGSGVIFTWTGPVTGDIVSVSSESTNINSATVADAGVYTLTATAPGCSGSIAATSGALVVNTLPSIVTASVSPNPACTGSLIGLTGGDSGDGIGVNYSWTGPVTGDISSPLSESASIASVAVADAGIYTLTATAAGCSGTATGVTAPLVVNTPPDITDFSAPTALSVCLGSGTTVTVNSSSLGAGTYTATYDLAGANTATGNTATLTMGASTGTFTVASTDLTNAGVTTLTITSIQNASGCTTNISTGNIGTFTVNASPAAAPTNNGYICNGGTVTLDANPSGGATVFTWSGDNLVAASGATTTATPTVTTTYTLTVSDGSGLSGCAPSTPYFTTVSVNATPAAAPTNNGYICSGGIATLTANPSGGATQFTWSGPSLIATSGASTTALPTATANYALTVSDGSGQPGCAPATMYVTSVSVNPAPAAAPANDGYICAGGTVTLTANESGSTSTFAWAGSNITGSAAANITTATPTANSTYTLTVSDGSTQSGCVKQFVTTVSVNAAPAVIANNSGNICISGTATLTATTIGGTVATYAWSGPGIISGAATATATAAPTATGTDVYTLTVTDGTSNSGCSSQAFTTLTVNATPTATANNSGAICATGAVTLTATATGGTVGSYVWTGSNITGGGTTASATASPATVGLDIYTLTVTNGTSNSGCTSQATTTVTVSETPLVTAANSGYICATGTATLTATATGGTIASYTWSGPSIVTGGTTATATVAPTSTGTNVYTLTVTDGTGASGCSSESTTTVTVNATPTATATNSGAICASGTATLTATTTGGSIGSYSWTGADLLSGTASDIATAAPTTIVTITYTLTVTDGTSASGCTSQSTTTVTVSATPTATASNSGVVCVTGTATLTATTTGGAVTSYAWSGADITSGATTSASTVDPTTAGTSVYTLTVSDGTANAGCTTQSVTTLTVNATPVATANNSGTICAGGTATLTATVTGGAVTSYTWNGSDIITGASADVATAAPAGSATYTLTVSDGTGNPGCSSQATTTVSVNAAPSLSTAGNSSPVCEGNTFTLTALDPLNVTDFSWSGPVAVTDATTAAGSVSAATTAAAGTYTVVVSNGAGSGCSVSYTTIATINSLPAIYTVTGSSSYCSADAGVDVGLSGSDTGVTYTLYDLGASVATTAGTGSAISFGVYPTGSYSVSASNNTAGCGSNMTATLDVTVNTSPAVYGVTGGGSYCAGSGGVHVFLGLTDTGVNYQLFEDGTLVGTFAGTGGTLDFGLITGGGTYTVSAVNATSGCTSSMADSAVVTIVLPVTPSVTLSTGIGDTSCAGSAVTFTASGTNGGITPGYLWSVNGTDISGATSDTYNYTPANGDVVTVTMISSEACAAPDTVFATDTITVLEHATPTVTMTMTGSTCAGLTVTFTATPAFGGSLPNFTWKVNGATVGSGSTFSYVPANGDEVWVEMVSNYPCVTTSVASSAHMFVSVGSAPVVTITATQGFSIVSGSADTLTAHVTGATAVTYQWSVNHLAITGATDSTFINTYTSNDSVTCTVTTTDACALTDSETVLITVIGVGVKNVVTGATDIRLIPNPNKGTFSVSGTFATAEEDVVLEVTDMLGQVIYRNNAKVDNGVINAQVQLTNTLANGMYIMNVRSGNENKVFHFVIEQ